MEVEAGTHIPSSTRWIVLDRPRDADTVVRRKQRRTYSRTWPGARPRHPRRSGVAGPRSMHPLRRRGWGTFVERAWGHQDRRRRVGVEVDAVRMQGHEPQSIASSCARG